MATCYISKTHYSFFMINSNVKIIIFKLDLHFGSCTRASTMLAPLAMSLKFTIIHHLGSNINTNQQQKVMLQNPSSLTQNISNEIFVEIMATASPCQLHQQSYSEIRKKTANSFGQFQVKRESQGVGWKQPHTITQNQLQLKSACLGHKLKFMAPVVEYNQPCQQFPPRKKSKKL